MSNEESAAMAGNDAPAVAVAEQEKQQTSTKRKKQPRYHVVLWDDDDHSYEYVESMMRSVFAHTSSMGYKIARAVDTYGRATCLTTTREHAELKRDQIHSFGRDALITRCAGSMTASIEPETSE